MSQKPLVARPELAVHHVRAAFGAIVGVGAQRQGDEHAEALRRVGVRMVEETFTVLDGGEAEYTYSLYGTHTN